MTRGSPASTPYPNPQTPYPSWVRVCITRRWTRVVRIPVSPRGYQEPAAVFHTRDRTNVPCVSRDTPVLAGAVTNTVTRARWPSSIRRCGHRRRSPSWVDGRRPPPPSRRSSGVRRSSSVVGRRSFVCRRRRRRSSLSSVVVVVVVASSSPLPSSSERDSQLAVTEDDDVFERRPRRAFSCRRRRGAAWLLLCGRAARQCGWASEEAATHLCWVVGAPPTQLSPFSAPARRVRRRPSPSPSLPSPSGHPCWRHLRVVADF